MNQNGPQKAVRESLAPRPVRRYRTWLFQGYVVMASVFFVFLAILSRTANYFPFDLIASRFVQSFNAPAINYFMQFVSLIGREPQMGIISVLILFLVFALGLRYEAVIGALALISSDIFETLVKILVNRPRPSPDLVRVFTTIHQPSFPSGHVLTYSVLFGYLFFLAYSLLTRSTLRTTLLIVFGSLIILIGPSRVYLGEHWSSDVLGGYLLGSIWLILTIWVYRRFKNPGKSLSVSVPDGHQDPLKFFQNL